MDTQNKEDAEKRTHISVAPDSEGEQQKDALAAIQDVQSTELGIGSSAPYRMNKYEHLHDQHKKKKGNLWQRMNYAARLSAMFGFISAMTALTIVVAVTIMLANFFSSDVEESIRPFAEGLSDKIAEQYDEAQEWNSTVLEPVRQFHTMYMGVGVIIEDVDGRTIYDSSTEKKTLVQSFKETDKSVLSDIWVRGTYVGNVRLWVSGNNSIINKVRILFRRRSFLVLEVAGMVAIFLSCMLGYLFARKMLKPIIRITRTAESIKNGNLSARTGLSGDDEISSFAKSFDAMATSIENDRNLERRITTDVAHELRTPLMAIQATVEAMIDKVFPADEARLVVVNSEVQRLSRLVGSMLKLSRLENRSNTMKVELVDVGQLVSTIVSTHDIIVEESGLSLSHEIEKNVFVMGDPDLIRQATANLISNAVRYTPEGGHILVKVKKGEIMASIVVEDDGVGLTPSEARMVFSRFWRADSGRKCESGGLGIGLSIVKEIVDRHKGWVNVEGRKGEGTRFTINIPLFSEEKIGPSKATRRGR